MHKIKTKIKTKIIRDINTWRDIRKNQINSDKSIGLIMTMGNLHQGHASLMEKSISENDVSILTIFVNPTQFNNKTDLDNYPKTEEDDINLAEKLGIDFILIFNKKDLYPDDYKYQIKNTSPIGQIMEGEMRPGHFDGMLSIVLKMHCLTLPHKSYFGEKDYQQYKLIKEMLNAYLLNTEVIGCPIIRNKNNLALSSRNNRLNQKDLKLAEKFPEILSNFNLNNDQVKQELIKHNFKVDYVYNYDNRRFGAVFLNDVRLIDNLAQTNPTFHQSDNQNNNENQKSQTHLEQV